LCSRCAAQDYVWAAGRAFMDHVCMMHSLVWLTWQQQHGTGLVRIHNALHARCCQFYTIAARMLVRPGVAAGPGVDSIGVISVCSPLSDFFNLSESVLACPDSLIDLAVHGPDNNQSL
jgi:hypothetical protein